jgi:hypothetical protein
MSKTLKPSNQRDVSGSTSAYRTQSSSSESVIMATQFDFVSKYEISQLTGLAPATLKRYRLSGRLSEGIHWVRLNDRVIRYNKPLMRDWMQNQGYPHLHQKAIESYLATLPSHEKSRKHR